MLSSRDELAKLCGYETFAHRSVVESLSRSPENVERFLTHLSERMGHLVSSEYELLDSVKRKSGSTRPLEIWDVPYFIQQSKKKFFHEDVKSISEYFSLGTCMDGLNTVLKSIFNISLVNVAPDKGELWHASVKKLAVIEGDSKVLGYIFCDFFARSGKPHQDCHYTIRGGRELPQGSYQDPVVVLMLSLPSSSWNKPSLLSPSMIDNLFHEMGHAIHSMLARTKYQHVTGTRCSTDFAEVPSTLLEYFANDPRVLSTMGRHYKSGDPIPENLLQKYTSMKKLFLGVEVHGQLLNSIVDQRFHAGTPSCRCPFDIYRDSFAHHYPQMSYPEDSAWYLRFSHLVGYGAKYYSYLMAKAVASTIWRRNFKDDPLNLDAGRKYRDACLVHGGSRPSYELVSDYIGESATSELLVNALVDEIEESKESLRDVKEGL
eukprot:TRINITY_DN1385_c0_g1_i1.p1 TRINITY_DN1385_c0_g1~~TRINITY_DN1385_c0_g1_i1.p1  ORF type:complete len:432 (-),score=111.82 TRINITY_DN1385_c0_g1_i1:1130-2425(-)